MWLLLNHGTYWSVGEMKFLLILHKEGKTVDHIAKVLERTPSACDARLRMIKTALMYNSGDDSDTLKTFKL